MEQKDLINKMELFMNLIKELDNEELLKDCPIGKVEDKLDLIITSIKKDLPKDFNNITGQQQIEFQELVDTMQQIMNGEKSSINNIEEKKEKILKKAEDNIEEHSIKMTEEE